MRFWWLMLLVDLLTPIVMVIAGRMMWKHCPKHISRTVGYRTSRSMQNMDTWKFAHDHCGRLWWKMGSVMVFPTIVIHIPFYGSDEKTIGSVGIVLVTIQLTMLIASIFSTETALRKAFHKDGTRK